ncbi:MAG: recombinase [Okeania sp. SIO2D1]|nr:recombinase [Okeania sp. SIO2D1]
MRDEIKMKTKRKICKIPLLTGSKPKTYREIFQEIEEQFFSGINKSTKRKRNPLSINDQNSFNRTKLVYFNRVSDWNEYPTVELLKASLYSFTPGTKNFKDAFYTYKQVASKATNNQELINSFVGIDTTQTSFQQRQSISWNDFFSWHQECSKCCKESYKSWLWVSAMCVVYGLRPSEIAAAQNLTNSWEKDNVTIPAINNFSNKKMLLVIGEKTYFGAMTKTGLRIARPMEMDENIWNQLDLRNIMLPKLSSNSSNPKTLVNLLSNRFRKALKKMKSPVTQAYAFRHLANQLGEKNGIPQEIRARALGHSVDVNKRFYKSRFNPETEVDLLLNFSSPFFADIAVEKIKAIKEILQV